MSCKVPVLYPFFFLLFHYLLSFLSFHFLILTSPTFYYPFFYSFSKPLQSHIKIPQKHLASIWLHLSLILPCQQEGQKAIFFSKQWETVRISANLNWTFTAMPIRIKYMPTGYAYYLLIRELGRPESIYLRYSPKISSNLLTTATTLDEEMCETLSCPQEKSTLSK